MFTLDVRWINGIKCISTPGSDPSLCGRDLVLVLVLVFVCGNMLALHRQTGRLSKSKCYDSNELQPEFNLDKLTRFGPEKQTNPS